MDTEWAVLRNYSQKAKGMGMPLGSAKMQYLVIAPYKGRWAIPGGFVGIDEDLDAAAMRELREETGVRDVYLEQLYTFGNPKRDPRGRVITVAYFALVNSSGIRLNASTDAEEARWHSVYKLPSLAFDHSEILDYALKRLRYKLEYTTVAFQLLPEKFTLTELQQAYEKIFNRALDKRNFRKKIMSLKLIEEAGRLTGVSHRPAKLYSFEKEHRALENFFRA